MDNNSSLKASDVSQPVDSTPAAAPITPQPTSTENVIPPATSAPQTIVSQSETSGSHKTLVIIMVIVVIILLVGAGGYLFMSREVTLPFGQSANTQNEEVTTTPSQTQTVSQEDELQQDLNSADAVDQDTDTTEVDQDIQGL